MKKENAIRKSAIKKPILRIKPLVFMTDSPAVQCVIIDTTSVTQIISPMKFDPAKKICSKNSPANHDSKAFRPIRGS